MTAENNKNDLPPVPKKATQKKRKFASKADMNRYIECFKIKYKTEICKNWTLTGVCAF